MKNNPLSRAYKFDFFGPLFILLQLLVHLRFIRLLIHYMAPRFTPFMFFAVATIVLFIINLASSSDVTGSRSRGMLHLYWIRGATAVLAAVSYLLFVPVPLSIYFVIGILLLLSGILSIILATIALSGTKSSIPAGYYPPAFHAPVCLSCGAAIPETGQFCSRCGAPRPAVPPPYPPAPQAATCLRCGTPLAADHLFCGTCGAPRQT